MMRKLLTPLFFLVMFLNLTTGCAGETDTTDGEKTNTERVAGNKAEKPKAKPQEVASPPLPSNPGNIDASAFVELIAEVPELQILDVRTPEEVAESKIENAVVINIHDADFANRAAQELDKSKPLAVYCKGGGRSARAVKILSKNGFSQTYNLVGGISRWIAEGNPVVK